MPAQTHGTAQHPGQQEALLLRIPMHTLTVNHGIADNNASAPVVASPVQGSVRKSLQLHLGW